MANWLRFAHDSRLEIDYVDFGITPSGIDSIYQSGRNAEVQTMSDFIRVDHTKQWERQGNVPIVVFHISYLFYNCTMVR